MSSCYVCNRHNWFPTEDVSSNELHELLASTDLTSLGELVRVLVVFRTLKRRVKHALLDYHHDNCHVCPRCNRHASYTEAKRAKITAPRVASDCDFTEAYLKALQLTPQQYDALTNLSECRREILDIHRMIGMKRIKTEFAKVIKYLTYNKRYDSSNELMHIAIFGPPGHGKTEIARLLAKAFARSGLLSEPDVFVTARRSDLIGKYCGHTAKNTTEMFDKARGGVIFIDEIYALGNAKKDDVFTGECINTINQLLSERTDTLCIIAGYEKEADESFFAYNKGLRRRFPFRFVIDPYDADDLVSIFVKLARDKKWKVQPDALRAEDIEPHRDTIFDNAGGDMNNLLVKCIIAHYQLAFLSSDDNGAMELTRDDVIRGLEDYKENKKKAGDDTLGPPPVGMYV